MTAFLVLLTVAVTAVAAVLLWLLLAAKKQLARYKSVADLEQYKADCERDARAAVVELERVQHESAHIEGQIAKRKSRVRQYQQFLGGLHTAAELKQRIHSDTEKAKRIAATLLKLDSASKLDEHIRAQHAEIATRKQELETLGALLNDARTAGEIAAQVQYYENYLAQLKADIESVEEAGELQEFGFYRPHYEFESSEEYRRRLDEVRALQKDMLKSKSACVCSTEWTVDGNKSAGKKMVTQQVTLMLRAFNGESDAAVSKVRYNNVVALENRIKRSFDAINKLGDTKRIYLTAEYCKLKYQELYLAHELQEKKQEEREEHQRIREQMKEEAKVAKEIDKACKDAERDETMKAQALEQARQELAHQTGQHTEKLESLVTKLENELKEALDRKAKAIARAQLTRSGHVYVLSNLGTFGEGVYKIGLTRRLEPLERVKELGGAAVPFPFDVHAMIYSEDAPKLENALHRHFAARRVNMVNLRREFFRVSLEEIRTAVAEHFGHITFVTVPHAEEYRKTSAMLKDSQRKHAPLQIA